MATLFVLSHAPHTDVHESKKIALAKPGDGVILIEDAVYGATRVATPLTPALEDGSARGVNFYVLKPDSDARGVETELPAVDYGGFVDLIMEYDRAVH